MKFKKGDRVRFNGYYKRCYPYSWNRKVKTVTVVDKFQCLLRTDVDDRGWWDFAFFKKVI